ncbi:MAG: polysaccharide biosynthesis tyrosine autokinase [Clostridiales bacterium]|nr:polysaccharide biosynthesis tyrosine autokinase [Clostridiales bacterium]
MPVSSKNESNQEVEKIDLMRIIMAMVKSFKKTWFLGILLMALVGGGLVMGRMKSYHPIYTAYADFVINAEGDISSYETMITIEQLSSTFPYILTSGALSKVVCEDLGVSSLPAEITASAIENTNLFQMRATGSNAQKVYDTLQSVIANYPSIARYIIGNTTLTLLNESGVPTVPDQVPNYQEEGIKGALIGLLIYLIILFLLNFVSKTVISSSDLKKYTQVNYLAGVPDARIKKHILKKERPILVSDHMFSHFDEAINTLRIRLERTARGSGDNTFVFTSAQAGEGKTTICINTALAFAMKGYKILLVDGDLRIPSVSTRLNLNTEKGLADVLRGACEAKDTIQQYGDLPLYVLPGGKPVSNSSSLLGRPELENLIQTASEEMDYVFVDAPPCGLMQDAMQIMAAVKNVVMVVRQDYSHITKVLECIDSIKETGGAVTGYVINRESTGIGSYGYGKYNYGKYGYGKSRYGSYGYGEPEKGKE